MESNWFAINRKFIESDEWTHEPFTKAQAWIDLVGLARFKDGTALKRGIEFPVLRGQLCWSEVNLSLRWQWSRDKTRRFLSYLKTRQQIIQQKTNVTTLLTIVNYDSYQPNDTANDTANNTPEKQQTIHQKNTKEECIEGIEGKNRDICPEPEVSRPEADDIFLTFICTGQPKEFYLLKSKVDEYRNSYDTIDVEREIKKASQWLIDNKSRKKTAGGMPRFLGAWLARAANCGGSPSTFTKTRPNKVSQSQNPEDFKL